MGDESAAIQIDADLLKKSGEGDRAAFEQFYDRVSGLLFAMAYRVLNDREAAEDVLQEVFTQIWEKASGYDVSRGRPLTWALTMTRNKAIDRLRTAQRRYRQREELEFEGTLHREPSGKSSAETLAESEKTRMVRAAVTRLAAAQRRAIELAFFGGMTQSEIAAEFGEPLGTIKARIRRGMMRLRELIGGGMRGD